MHIRKEDGSLSENKELPEKKAEGAAKPAAEGSDAQAKRTPPAEGKAPSGAHSGQRPRSAAGGEKRPPAKRPAGAQGSGQPQRRRPPNAASGRGPAGQGSANGAQRRRRPPQNGSSTESAQRNGVKRPAPGGKRPPQGKKPSASGKRLETVPKKQQTAPESGSKKKAGFTKKQALTVAALILILLLILALVVVLILWHYFGLFDRKHKDRTTSEVITYSDVDYSRADTTDKVTEDEKLKELTAQAEKISNKDVMNILLIGEDLRDTAEQTAGNTDVMMLISINTKDKTITQTSIMRDCYVGFQDENGWWWYSRINAAYWYGGVKLTKSTVENYLNVKIDRYVLVNFNVFIDIVDALGGIDMHVTDEEANGYPGADPNGDNTRGMQNPLDEQNKYLHNKKGTDYIKKGGDLHLNGNQALAYARLRYVGNADFERTERQRTVISSILSEVKKNPFKLYALANGTDVTSAEMAQLLIDMLDYRNYTIQELRIPADDTFTNQIIDGMDVLSVDFPTNAQMFKELVYGSIDLEEDGSEKKKNIE